MKVYVAETNLCLSKYFFMQGIHIAGTCYSTANFILMRMNSVHGMSCDHSYHVMTLAHKHGYTMV